jgi:hypothetical protein
MSDISTLYWQASASDLRRVAAGDACNHAALTALADTLEQVAANRAASVSLSMPGTPGHTLIVSYFERQARRQLNVMWVCVVLACVALVVLVRAELAMGQASDQIMWVAILYGALSVGAGYEVRAAFHARDRVRRAREGSMFSSSTPAPTPGPTQA